MDQPKIERLLRLMKIMSGKEDYTVNQLAKKMGTSYRSIYRYIDTFKDSGFMVIKKSGNVYKLGKMPKKHVDLKDRCYFTEEEAYIIDSVIDRIDCPDGLKERAKSKLAAICTSYLEQTGQPIQRSETEKKDCFRKSGTEPIHVKLMLSETAKDILISEYPLAGKDLRHTDEQWILETEVYSLEGVGRFVLGLAGEIEVVDSPELFQYLTDFVNKYIKNF